MLNLIFSRKPTFKSSTIPYFELYNAKVIPSITNLYLGITLRIMNNLIIRTSLCWILLNNFWISFPILIHALKILSQVYMEFYY